MSDEHLNQEGLGEFHHVGIAVPSLRVTEDVRALLSGEVIDRGEDADLNIEWVWIGSPGSPIIELIAPLPGDGPIARWLARRGPGLHHLSFMPRDLDLALEHTHRCGLPVLAEERSHPEYEQFYVDPHATGGALFHAFRFMAGAERPPGKQEPGGNDA